MGAKATYYTGTNRVLYAKGRSEVAWNSYSQTYLWSPQPVTKKDVRAFPGLVGYYWWFIPQFAVDATPLTDLICKEAEVAFQKLIGLLTEMPVSQS